MLRRMLERCTSGANFESGPVGGSQTTIELLTGWRHWRGELFRLVVCRRGIVVAAAALRRQRRQRIAV